MIKKLSKICSQDNSTFKLALSLNNRKFRKKYSLFLIEGTRAIVQAKENSIKLKCIFVSEEFMKNYSKSWDNINSSIETEKYMLNASLFDKLSDTVTSQGIVAMCEMPRYNIQEVLSKQKSIILLLDQIQDPGNLGTIIRTSLAYGVDAIFLTKGTVDAFSPKVSRASMSGNICLPIIEIENDIDYFKKLGYSVYSTSLDEESVSYREVVLKSKILLVLGNEGNGVSQSIIKASDYKIIIPIKDGMESLNVGIACGILVNEISHKLYS